MLLDLCATVAECCKNLCDCNAHSRLHSTQEQFQTIYKCVQKRLGHDLLRAQAGMARALAAAGICRCLARCNLVMRDSVVVLA